MTRMVPAALCCALLTLVPGSPAQSADRKQRLEDIRREIEQREARARAYAEEAEGHFQELDGIDRELSETRRSVRRLRERQQTAEQELEEARAGLAEVTPVLERTRTDLETRLIALYKFGSTGGIPALYSARDFQAFARRRQGLAQVLEHDTSLFNRHLVARNAFAERRDRQEQLMREIRAARREIGARQERMRRSSVERHNLVALLRSRSDEERRTAEELRKAARRLERALRRMPSGFTPAAGEGLRPGAVPWPVQGRIRNGFGPQVDPEFGTRIRRTGIEIEAATGAPVRAVAPGRVIFAGWFRGYGQLVILDHGRDSVTVSGYLEEIAVDAGATLKRGHAIGTVGETGSLSGPGLYFEIRREGKPVDPQGWLESRAKEGK